MAQCSSGSMEGVHPSWALKLSLIVYPTLRMVFKDKLATRMQKPCSMRNVCEN